MIHTPKLHQLVFDQPQLIVEQLFKFQPTLRLLEPALMLRQMNVPDCVALADESIFLNQFSGQGFVNMGPCLFEQLAHHFGNRLTIEVPSA